MIGQRAKSRLEPVDEAPEAAQNGCDGAQSLGDLRFLLRWAPLHVPTLHADCCRSKLLGPL